MAKHLSKIKREQIDKAYKEFVDSYEKMEANTADFFRFHVIEGVDRIEAFEMTHVLPEFNGEKAHIDKRKYIRKAAYEKTKSAIWYGTKQKWYTYKLLKSEAIGERLLEQNLKILDADMSKTTYVHPRSGKPVTRHPGQLGSNERAAAQSMSSVKGRTVYKFESKTQASKIIMELTGLRSAIETNVHISNDDAPLQYLFGGMAKNEDEE